MRHRDAAAAPGPPAAALKAAVDPQTGSRVLAVGPLSKLRAALREQDSAAEVPAGVVFAASGWRCVRGVPRPAALPRFPRRMLRS